MKLVFATHNQNKFAEVEKLMPLSIQLVSLMDVGCIEEIPETGTTLEANAKLKANFVTKNFGLPCFADDTGLLVDALNGAPGVYSARYAGEQKSATDNMEKLLTQLKDENDRTAQFSTVIALNLKKESHTFVGTVTGAITTKKHGEGGFGYDPIFRPLGYDKTFAELPLSVKNQISHRGRAVQNLLDFLNRLDKKQIGITEKL